MLPANVEPFAGAFRKSMVELLAANDVLKELATFPILTADALSYVVPDSATE